MVDSYITRHGNGVASCNMNDADPPAGTARLHDEVQNNFENDILIDISS